MSSLIPLCPYLAHHSARVSAMNGAEVGVSRLNLLQWGYLNKKNNRDAGGRKSKDRRWQTYWVELFGREMRFFRNASLGSNSSRLTPPRDLSDAESTNLQLAGFRTLSDVDARVDYANERDHVFVVRANGGETFYQAPTKSSMLKWLAALNDVNEIDGMSEETRAKVESLVLKYRREQFQSEPAMSRSYTTLDSDDDLLDEYDLPQDPRIGCLQEQLRQRYALLRQLEEQEKAFLDSKTSTTGPETFKRCHFVATVTKKYYLVPGSERSVLKPGSKVNVFGQLPNGRWRCSAQKEGHFDVYGSLDGEAGLSIKINEDGEEEEEKPKVKENDTRLSIMSEPDCTRKRGGFFTSQKCPDVIKEEVTASPSIASISDEDLISKSTTVKHQSVIVQGDMYPGLGECLAHKRPTVPSLILPSSLGNDDVTVLVTQGLFKGESSPVVTPIMMDNDVTTTTTPNQTFTIHQSTIRKSFPLIGSVPSSVLWELKDVVDAAARPPLLSESTLESPDVSPAPSPITSPLVTRSPRRSLLSHDDSYYNRIALPLSHASPDVVRRSRVDGSASPAAVPRVHSDNAISTRSDSFPATNLFSNVTLRSRSPRIEIRSKIRSRGISLIVGETSSEEEEEEEEEENNDADESQRSSVSDEAFLKHDDGLSKNQSDQQKFFLPRSSETLYRASRRKVNLGEFPSGRGVQKSKSATLPLKSRNAVSSGSESSSSSKGSTSSPTKGLFGFITNKFRVSKSPQPHHRRVLSERIEPKHRLSEPEVRPPMNERRTLLLKKGPRGWGFKVETSGTGKEKRTYVVEVVEDMPAFYGGLRPGDAILEIDGEDLESAAHEKIVAALKSCGDSVRIAVKFADGVRRIELLRKKKRLENELHEKQREMYRLMEREIEILGDFSSGEEQSSEKEEEEEEGVLANDGDDENNQ